MKLKRENCIFNFWLIFACRTTSFWLFTHTYLVLSQALAYLTNFRTRSFQKRSDTRKKFIPHFQPILFIVHRSTFYPIVSPIRPHSVYTGWLVNGGTSGKGVILREKRSRKYRIKIFLLRLGFLENRLWIFARYACTLSRLVITDLTVDGCLDEYYRSLSLFLP